MHVIAGPNGAGKTTLYQLSLKPRFPGLEFVNADDLALKRFGHPAQNLPESQEGQRLADERRGALMAARKSLITESTFSHESKLQLVRDAKELRYAVHVYHVHVRSAELSVLRVQQRVERGGHPVPEDKIRERYVRNQALIREAVRMADRAYVLDNSKLGEPHKLAISLQRGEVIKLGANVPAWARDLYAAELQRFSPLRVNAGAASFEQAKQLVKDHMGEQARLYIARPGPRYNGEIIGQTSKHIVQKLREGVAVAHFSDRLAQAPAIGDKALIAYPDKRGQTVSVQLRARAATEPLEELRRLAMALPEGEGKAMAAMLEALRAGQRSKVQALLERSPAMRKAVGDMMKDLDLASTSGAIKDKRRDR
ncbi:MAG: zeta toxin family protein [Burkholderiales bacterium]|nr:zeta toxin family protein [Burkholderiales bacterium]